MEKHIWNFFMLYCICLTNFFFFFLKKTKICLCNQQLPHTYLNLKVSPSSVASPGVISKIPEKGYGCPPYANSKNTHLSPNHYKNVPLCQINDVLIPIKTSSKSKMRWNIPQYSYLFRRSQSLSERLRCPESW